MSGQMQIWSQDNPSSEQGTGDLGWGHLLLCQAKQASWARTAGKGDWKHK